MARWEPDAQGRLEEAAAELYAERGYEHTTVADVAERAGLTRRTYFRYFADKREVLFARAGALEELWIDTVVAAPAGATALEAVAAALDASAARFEDRKPSSARRHAILGANPELQERELIKLARLAEATAAALRGRGIEERSATLAAEMGVTVLRLAFARWVEPANQRTLAALMQDLLATLRDVAAA